MGQPVNRTGAGAGGDVVLIALGGVVLGSAGIVWGGAWFAALLGGGTLSGGVGDAVDAMGPLASSPGDPAAAWGDAAEGLPGPVPVSYTHLDVYKRQMQSSASSDS